MGSFSTSAQGNYTWTPPAGVFQATITVIGGGAGGARGGGGGGAGGSASSTLTVSPSTTYNYTVGAHGGSPTNGSSEANGFNGTDSFFGNSSPGSETGASVWASPGTAGLAGSGAGTGGSKGSGQTGSTLFNGGNGGNGTASSTSTDGGGGGGGAGGGGAGSNGSAAAGSAGGGSGGAGGTFSHSGGNGGTGSTNINTGGSAGSGVGSGGGGGGYNAGTPSAKQGGSGTDGAVYGDWTDPTTVTFNAGNGSGSGSQSSNISKALTTVATLGMTGNGTFQGWATSAGSATIAYADGATYNFPGSGSTTLYAVWQTTVSFNANGGTGSGSQTSTGATNLTSLSSLGIKYTDNVFNGWATTPTGSVAYNDGASYPFIAGGTVTLYANWTNQGSFFRMM